MKKGKAWQPESKRFVLLKFPERKMDGLSREKRIAINAKKLRISEHNRKVCRRILTICGYKFEKKNLAQKVASEISVKILQYLGSKHPRRLEAAFRARKIPGFKEARNSWISACGVYFERHGFRQTVKAETPQEADEALFFRLVGSDPSRILKNNAPLICAAAERGDVDFFNTKMAAAFKRNRRSQPRRAGTPDYHILLHWLFGGLWLMSAESGANAFEKVSAGKRISVHSYTMIVRRLRLKGWKTANKKPPITGYHPKTDSFGFSETWTHLEPKV